MLTPDEKGRIALGVIGLFALGYSVDAVRKKVFVMAIRNVPRTVEIQRNGAPIRYWLYISLLSCSVPYFSGVLGTVFLSNPRGGQPQENADNRPLYGGKAGAPAAVDPGRPFEITAIGVWNHSQSSSRSGPLSESGSSVASP